MLLKYKLKTKQVQKEGAIGRHFVKFVSLFGSF